MQKKTFLNLVLIPTLGALLNVVLATVNRELQSPLFLDSVLTAVVSVVWGRAPGLVTAVLSQGGMEVVVTAYGAPGTSWPFVVCSLATASILGTFAREGRFSTLLDLVLATVAVTLANAVIGAFTATLVFRDVTLHGSDSLEAILLAGGQSLLGAAFWTRIPLNLIDKGIAVEVAFLALRASASTVRRRIGAGS